MCRATPQYISMSPFPFRTFAIETPLAPPEVLARVRRAAEPPPFFPFTKEHRPFIGTVTGKRFEIWRVIHYSNAFRPRVRGAVEPMGSGSRVTGSMRLHWAPALFAALWLSAAGVALVMMTSQMLTRGPFDPFMVLIPLGFLAAGTGFVWGSFAPEARTALSELSRLLDASSTHLH